MSYYDLDATKTFLISQKAIVTQEDRLLVLKIAQGSLNAESLWELPGGLLEMEEDLETGLRREVREETNLDVAVGQLISIWNHWQRGFIFEDGRILDVRMITLAYICNLVGGCVELSDEHSEYMWAAKSELAHLNLAPNSSIAIGAYSRL